MMNAINAMKENYRKCFKCGRSPARHPNIKLFRFPKPGLKNITRCESWAKYCFPECQWSSPEFLKKLFSEHKMLCNRHFKATSFSDWPDSKINLHRHAVPEDITHEEDSQQVSSTLTRQVIDESQPSTNLQSQSYWNHANVESCVSMHVFPHPDKFPETFKAWVKIAGGKLETPDDNKYYRNKKICSIHFTDQDRNRNKRLNALAVPTLYLPGNVNSGNPDHIYYETSENSPGVSVAQTSDSAQIVENEEPIPGLTEETVEEYIVENVPTEGQFSWQQLSKVVPCDSEDNTEKKTSRNEQATSRDIEMSYPGRLKDTGTLRESETPGHLETPHPEKSERLETSINTTTESPEKESPARYLCNACEQHIHGYRYVCVQCADFDLCAACEAAGRHQVHYVLGVPQGKAKDEVESVLQTIRRALSNCIIDLTEGEVKVKEETDQEDPIAVSSEVPNTEDPTVHMEDPIGNTEDLIHVEDSMVHMDERTDTDMFYNEDPITLGTEDPKVHELVPDVSDASDLILHLENSTASKQKPASPQQKLTKPSNVILELERDNSGGFIVTSRKSKAMHMLQVKEQNKKTSAPRIVTVPNACVSTSGVRIVTAVKQCLSTSGVKVVSARAQCANPSPGALKRHMPVKVIGMTSPECKKVATTVRLRRLTKQEIKAALHKN